MRRIWYSPHEPGRKLEFWQTVDQAITANPQRPLVLVIHRHHAEDPVTLPPGVSIWVDDSLPKSFTDYVGVEKPHDN